MCCLSGGENIPNIKSSKKRVNVIKRQSKENIPVRGSMRTAVKKAVKDNNSDNINDAVKKIDSAVSKGVITKNAAARKKSRLMKKVNSK